MLEKVLSSEKKEKHWITSVSLDMEKERSAQTKGKIE